MFEEKEAKGRILAGKEVEEGKGVRETKEELKVEKVEEERSTRNKGEVTRDVERKDQGRRKS